MRLAYAILAGGKGTRMRELTRNTSKCMLEYKGRPILSYVVDNLISAGANEIVITVAHGKDIIIEYLTKTYPQIKFNFILDPLAGTGKSVEALGVVEADYFLIMMCDLLFDSSEIVEFVNVFKKNPGNYIMSRKVINPEKYGVLEVENNRIVKIVEKPTHPKSNLVNLANYILDKKIFEFTKDLQKSIRGEYDLPEAIQKSIDSGNTFYNFTCNSIYLDFTKPEDLKQKN